MRRLFPRLVFGGLLVLVLWALPVPVSAQAGIDRFNEGGLHPQPAQRSVYLRRCAEICAFSPRVMTPSTGEPLPDPDTGDLPVFVDGVLVR